MMELGIFKGASLRMWQHFLPRATIHGLDNGRLVTREEMAAMETKQISTFVADQKDRESLRAVVEGHTYDVIVEDGHHYMDTQQVSLGFLFPYVKPGGVFIMEDIHPLGNGFGQVDRLNNTDSTLEIIYALKENRPITSPHLFDYEVAYLREQIAHIYVQTIERRFQDNPDVVHEHSIAFFVKKAAKAKTEAA